MRSLGAQRARPWSQAPPHPLHHALAAACKGNVGCALASILVSTSGIEVLRSGRDTKQLQLAPPRHASSSATPPACPHFSAVAELKQNFRGRGHYFVWKNQSIGFVAMLHRGLRQQIFPCSVNCSPPWARQGLLGKATPGKVLSTTKCALNILSPFQNTICFGFLYIPRYLMSRYIIKVMYSLHSKRNAILTYR